MHTPTFADEAAALGDQTAAALGGSARACTGNGALADALAAEHAETPATPPWRRRVWTCDESTLNRRDWKALEAHGTGVWVRQVNEFGNDVRRAGREPNFKTFFVERACA